jgi:NADH:ubiquinone oxidoreductase subunit F (NADH-binding)
MHPTSNAAPPGGVVLSEDPVASVADYRARGGGQGLRAARSLGPWRTAEEVTLSGLRGRGGGGFRIGRKWLSVLDASCDDGHRFVVCNAAEGEPGTFKDRAMSRGRGRCHARCRYPRR